MCDTCKELDNPAHGELRSMFCKECGPDQIGFDPCDCCGEVYVDCQLASPEDDLLYCEGCSIHIYMSDMRGK